LSLYHKYRPSTFDEVIGNEEIKLSLQCELKKKDRGHCFLFHGQSGTGKTTFARIIANEVEAFGMDFKEMDSAQFRGIDTIRKIREDAMFLPFESRSKSILYLLDECFAPNTKISTIDGDKSINKLKRGDLVYCASGISEIENVFKNRIPLNRIIRLSLSNRKVIFTTKDHEFLTTGGFIKAKELDHSDLILPFVCDIMPNIISQKEGNHEHLSIMRKKIHHSLEKSSMLFTIMWTKIKECKTWIWKIRDSHLSALWEYISSANIFQKAILQYELCCEMELQQTRNERNTKIKISPKKDVNVTLEIHEQSNNKKEIFGFDACEEPNAQSKMGRENASDKKIEWNPSCVERGEGWKRRIHRGAIKISIIARMGIRICSILGKAFKGISNELQDRYCKSETENRNRSRWEKPQVEKKYIERFKKDGKIKPIRVENITFYECGNNAEHFASIIKDKERNQGFVEFYDLQIKKHPSYFANGCLVHNCHKLTVDAMPALLKILEDPPGHVYFVLCTTEPGKLIKEIRGRCLEYQTQLLSDVQMKRLLRRVVKKEQGELSEDVYEQVIRDSLGAPRNALQILDQVISLPKDKQLAMAKRTAETQSKVIELCRALMSPHAKWSEVSEILSGLGDENIEQMRWAVLGYSKTALLRGVPKAANIIDQFSEPFFNSGMPGFILACYYVVTG